MSHFLSKKELARSVEVEQRFAAIMICKPEGLSDLVLQRSESARFVVEGTRVAPLPAAFSVWTLEKIELKPLCRFWITIDTVDPYHCVIDWEGPGK
jgi:hypothetical protein